MNDLIAVKIKDEPIDHHASLECPISKSERNGSYFWNDGVTETASYLSNIIKLERPKPDSSSLPCENSTQCTTVACGHKHASSDTTREDSINVGCDVKGKLNHTCTDSTAVSVSLCSSCELQVNEPRVILEDLKYTNPELLKYYKESCDADGTLGSCWGRSSTDTSIKIEIDVCKDESVNYADKYKTGSERYKCQECSYSSSKNSNLQTHMRLHIGREPYKCVYCTYWCIEANRWKAHMKTHMGVRPYTCRDCNFSFKRSNNLKEHITRKHKGEKFYECKLCEYKGSMKHDLLRHELTHTGERPYKCRECSYSSTTSGHLTEHTRIHRGEQRYKCSQCEYRCNFPNDMKRHRLVHLGARVSECTECKYRGRTPNSLRVHKYRRHNGDKPFKCSLCEYRCTTSTYLKRHISKGH